MLKSIKNTHLVVLIISYIFIGCSSKTDINPNGKPDTLDKIITIFFDKTNHRYIFMGDKYTYVIKNNKKSYDNNSVERMSFMLDMIKKSKNWNFFENINVHKSLTKKGSCKAYIKLEIEPTKSQMAEFDKYLPGHRKQLHYKYQKKSSRFANFKYIDMDAKGTGCFLGFCSGVKYKFYYDFNEISISETTPEIKTKYGNYLLSKTINLKIHPPRKMLYRRGKMTGQGQFEIAGMIILGPFFLLAGLAASPILVIGYLFDELQYR